jgi:hypothetical protein
MIIHRRPSFSLKQKQLAITVGALLIVGVTRTTYHVELFRTRSPRTKLSGPFGGIFDIAGKVDTTFALAENPCIQKGYRLENVSDIVDLFAAVLNLSSSNPRLISSEYSDSPHPECAVVSGAKAESNISYDDEISAVNGPVIVPNYCSNYGTRNYGDRVDITIENHQMYQRELLVASCLAGKISPRRIVYAPLRAYEVDQFASMFSEWHAELNTSISILSPYVYELSSHLTTKFTKRNASTEVTGFSDFGYAAPTTGLHSIIFALLHCRKVKLFGFNISYANYGHWKGHDLEAEREIVRTLGNTLSLGSRFPIQATDVQLIY